MKLVLIKKNLKEIVYHLTMNGYDFSVVDNGVMVSEDDYEWVVTIVREHGGI